MPQTRNPATADRDEPVSFGDWAQEALSFLAYRLQFLIAQTVRPDLPSMLVAIAFGGGAA